MNSLTLIFKRTRKINKYTNLSVMIVKEDWVARKTSAQTIFKDKRNKENYI